VSAHILFFVSVIAASAVFALLEIQIEGSDGWASGLPTWRFQNAWTRLLFGARPVTGYHFYFQIFLLILLHLPYGLSLISPTWAAELRILAFLLLFWVVEDFLWFVLNPAFGLGGFRRENVHWHAQTWWGIMPRDYWIFSPIGLIAYVASWMV
jgi:hypothetical protein